MPNNQGIPKTDSFRTWSQNLHFDLQTNLDFIFLFIIWSHVLIFRPDNRRRRGSRRGKSRWNSWQKNLSNFFLQYYWLIRIDDIFHISRRGLSIWDGIRNWVESAGLKLRIRLCPGLPGIINRGIFWKKYSYRQNCRNTIEKSSLRHRQKSWTLHFWQSRLQGL